MSRRVAFVCQWYPPEPAAVPESIALTLALTDEDMTLEVLTGTPNYPSGKVAPGYRNRLSREVLRGLAVTRTPLYPSHDSSAFRRLLNYGSWALSAALFGQRTLRRADVALVYSSPATAAFPAMVAKRLWRTPYVLMIQDVWPDSIFASGFLTGRLGRLAHRFLNVFVGRTYELASHIAVTSPGMIDLLVKRGVPREKISVVYNWLPEGPQDVQERTEPFDGEGLRGDLGISADSRIFVYAGNHGHAQGLEAVVDAFLDSATAPSHLVLLGDGACKQALVRRASGSTRVHFLGRVPRPEAMRLVASADAHVVSLTDHPLFAVTMPSKVQAGLASGQPMLVVAEGDAAEAVAAAGAGVTASPGNRTAVVAAIRSLSQSSHQQLADMGRRGRKLYDCDMGPDVGASRLARLLAETAKVSRGPDQST